MDQQRDELGRFLEGNTVAVGNKGNENSKWGNKNAFKHGLYSITDPIVFLSRDKTELIVALDNNYTVRFTPDEWSRDEFGNIGIYGRKAKFLEAIGMELLDSPPNKQHT